MKQTWMAVILAGLAIGTGCTSESQRLADMANRTVELQSETNTTVADAGKEIAKLNREVQTERLELTQGQKQLETDRRLFNRQRRSDVVWAESFQFMAIIIAAAMPLFLCAYLIWAATFRPRDSELVNEVLMQELVTCRPRSIAGPNGSQGYGSSDGADLTPPTEEPEAPNQSQRLHNGTDPMWPLSPNLQPPTQQETIETCRTSCKYKRL